MDGDRESIWSVDRRVKNLYYILFSVSFFVGVSLLAYLGYTDKSEKTVLDKVVGIWKDAGLIVLASAAMSMTITEGGGYIVSLLSARLEELDTRRRKRRKEVEENILSRLPEENRERIRKELEEEERSAHDRK